MEDHPFDWSRSLRAALLVISLLGILTLPLTHAAAEEEPQPLGDGPLENLHTIGPPLTALRAKLADPRWLTTRSSDYGIWLRLMTCHPLR